jgi:hypothetical protein
MPNVFATTGGFSHTTLVAGLTDNQLYNYYVRCSDSLGNTNTSDYLVSFIVGTLPSDYGSVASYGFNEGTGTTVTDASGSNNTGTISGATWTTQGNYGNALSFDGVNDYVNIPANSSIGNLTSNLTLSAWVFLNDLTGVRTIWETAESPASNIGLSFKVIGGRLWLATKGVNDYFSVTASVSTGVWVHVAVVLDSGFDATFFVDGVQKDTITHTVGGNANTTQASFIGAGADNGGTPVRSWMNGRIDNLRIYNRVLTPAEIQSDMNTPVGSGGTNPVPALTTLVPSSATAGGGAFTLTVNGSNFVSGSAVRWNGAARTTTFVNATQVTAAIPASDIAAAGTAQVTVFNPAPGGGTSNALTFTINPDTTPPNTSITGSPSNPTNSSSASFSFTSTEAGSFQCQLDAAGFVSCTSPQNYNNLGNSSHTFQVRAVDATGNIDPTPAIYTWTIDTIAPDTTITATPSNPSSSSAASFSFVSTETGSFQCRLDGASFSACTSPKSYTGLTPGSHTFQVRAVDLAGNIDSTPASYTWTYTPVTRFPGTTVIQTGSLQGGTTASLNADDNNYYGVNSTTSGTLTTSWYGSFASVPSNLSNLKITYKGKNSRTCTQTIAIWSWTTSAWVQLDSRSVGTTEILISNLSPTGTLGNYVGSTGELRIRVRNTRNSQTFVTSGDLMQIVYDIP